MSAEEEDAFGGAPAQHGAPPDRARPPGRRRAGRGRGWAPARGGAPAAEQEWEGGAPEANDAPATGDDEEGGGPGGRRRRSGGRRRGAERGDARPVDPEEQARAVCLRLLTGTPRTRKQLADALRRRDIPDEVAERVLARFEDVGLIDDEVFANAWVESRHHGKGLARRALARELHQRGVADAVVAEAVGQLDHEQEEATARELVERKLRATRGMERDRRIRRLASMLARRGYGEGLALRVVRQALEEEGEDPEVLERYLPE